MKWLTLAILAVIATGASASEHKHKHKPRASNPTWLNECGSCHVAYPVRLLTEQEWLAMMRDLEHHFGENAELDADSQREITAFLVEHAGHGERHQARSLRITDTSWFQREHRRFSRADWANPAVRTPANCTACHVDGNQGKWGEHSIRVPKALRHRSSHDEDDD